MAVKLIPTKAAADVEYRFSLVPTSWGNVALVGDKQRLYRLIMPGYSRKGLIELVKQEFPKLATDTMSISQCHLNIDTYE